MKQIEREGSAQRQICALLEDQFPLTIKDIVGIRRSGERAIRREIDELQKDGYVQCEGYPRLYRRTDKPLPAAVPRKSRSEEMAERRQREKEALEQRFTVARRGEMERVFAAWASNGRAREAA